MEESAPERARVTTRSGGPIDSKAAGDPAELRRLSGGVCGLNRTIQVIRRGGNQGARIEFAVYRFQVDRLRLAFYVPRWLDDSAGPLLSERDRVELIAQRYTGRRPDADGIGDDGVVLALDNRQNARRYVCHSIFRWLALVDIAPVGYTPRMLREALYWTVGMSVAAIVLVAAIIGLDAALSSGQPSWSWLLDEGLWVVALVDAVIWVPVAVLQLRWRLGWPTRRQRYTDQVYAVMGFGSALRPVVGVVEL
ncbi:hypothetical protein LC55x_5677 [Lysobacter capsici]|nr:hypothetical protein LC55x_5677 [Lysobacter capsici]